MPTPTIVDANWTMGVSGAASGSFATPGNWSTNVAPDNTASTDYDVFISSYTIGGTTPFTVTSSTSETVDFLSVNGNALGQIGQANATLAITGGVFTVFSPVNPYSNAYIFGGGVISVGAGASMVFGQAGGPATDSAELFNNGTLTVAGTAKKAATLEVAAPWFELNSTIGIGVVKLSGNAAIVGATNAGTWLDNETNTIEGSGVIGNGLAVSLNNDLGLHLQNDARGTINANAAAALTLDTGTNAITNSGIIETTGAGGLNIDNSTVNQDGQLIADGAGALSIVETTVTGGGSVMIHEISSQAQTGSLLLLENGQLSMGGTITIQQFSSLSTVSGYIAYVVFNNVLAGDVVQDGDIENDGAITVADDSSLSLNGSIYGIGAIQLDGATGPTKLDVFGNGVALYAAGGIVLSDSAENSIISSNNGVSPNLVENGQQLSNYSSISGSGTIGDTWLRLFNATTGVVNANDSVGLTIVGDSAAVALGSGSAGYESADYNAGLIETTGAGGLTINGDLGNAGIVQASGAGALTLENGTISAGGILQTTAGGTIILDDYTSAQNNVIVAAGSALDIAAATPAVKNKKGKIITPPVPDTVTLANVFNSGTVNIGAGSTLLAENTYDNKGVINVNGASTSLEVVGNLTLAGGGTVNLKAGDAIASNGSSAGLTNLNNTIVGAGAIGDAHLYLHNYAGGTIDATGAVTLAVEASSQNDGVIETTGAGSLNIVNAMIVNGKLIAAGTGAITVDGNVTGDGSISATGAGASIVLNNIQVNTDGTVSTAAGSSIIAEGANAAIMSADVENAGILAVANGATLTLNGTVDNSGTLALQGSSAATTLEVASFLSLTGRGTVTLGAAAFNSIASNGAEAQLTNVNNLIEGAGTIGDAFTTLQNGAKGTIDATGALTLNTGSHSIQNLGTIESTGAGVLTIDSAMNLQGQLIAGGTGALTLTQSIQGVGSLEATAAGAAIDLSGAQVDMLGGLVSTVAGSAINATGVSSLEASDIENAGSLNTANGATLTLEATLDNAGTVALNGATAATALDVAGSLTLTGGGIVTLANATFDSIGSNVANPNPNTASLINVNDTISGAGKIGDSHLSLTNAQGGTIDATGALTLSAPGKAIVNAGTIEATGAGALTIDGVGLAGGDLQQNGNLIAGGASSSVSIVGAEVIGSGNAAATVAGASFILSNGILSLTGTVSTVAGAAIVTAANSVDELDAGLLNNAGAVTVADGSRLELSGPINNTGAISLASTGDTTTLEIERAGVALTGAGTLVLSDDAANNAVDVIRGIGGGTSQFTNSSTISGVGTIGGGSLQFVNLLGGVVNANGAAVTVNKVVTPALGLTIVGDTGGPSNSNAGLIETTGAGGLTINGALTNTGTVEAVGAGALTLANATVSGNGLVETAAGTAKITPTILLDDASISSGTVLIAALSKLNTTAEDSDTIQATVVNHGTINIAAGSTFSAGGNWTNAGAIALNGTTGGGNDTTLEADGGLSLSGGGTVTLNAFDSIDSNGSPASLTNLSDTIQGGGEIGDANLSLTNGLGGTIDANAGTMTIDTRARQISNLGTIETTATGNLTIGDSGTAGSLLQNGQLIASGSGVANTLTLVNLTVNGSGTIAATTQNASIELDGADLNVTGSVSTATGSSITTEADTTDEITAPEITNAGSIAISDGSSLTLGTTLYNIGMLALIGGADATELEVAGELALVGGGTVTMTSGGHNSIVSNVSGGNPPSAFLDNVNNTIVGAGTIGDVADGKLNLTNEVGGTIDAAVGTLTLNTGASPINNSGLIDATSNGGAGTLVIDSVMNQNGALEAIGSNATVDVDADVSGAGTIAAIGGGSIVLDDVTVTMSGNLSTDAAGSSIVAEGGADQIDAPDVDNAGTITVDDGTTLTLGTVLYNSGMLALAGVADATDLAVDGSLTLSGGGFVKMIVGSDDAIVSNTSNSPSALLTNLNNTIEGAGAIGDANMTLVNDAGGTIDATGVLTVNTGANIIDNAGLMESTGAGSLVIDSAMNLTGTIDVEGTGGATIGAGVGIDDAGSIIVGIGRTLTLDANASVSIDGTISTEASGSAIGTIAVAGSAEIVANDIENVGAITIADGATLRLNASINNSGTLNIGDANGFATLEIEGGSAEIAGTGSLILGSSESNLIKSNGAEEYFYNSSTITGDGLIGDADLSFQNLAGGVVDASGNTLSIRGDTTVAGSFSADYNAGVMEATQSGVLAIYGTPVSGQADFINAGVIEASGSGTVQLFAVTDTSGGGEVEATGTSTIELFENSIISNGFASISNGAQITTGSNTTDGLEVGTFNQGTVNVVDDSNLLVQGHWQNSGSVNISGVGDATAAEIVAGDTWELLGDGTVSLSDTSSIVSGAGASSSKPTTLDNVNNTIVGTGTIGDSNMAIDNHTGATIDATTGGLTISGSSTNYAYNSGLIETDSTHAGNVTITTNIQNDGQLTANAGGAIDVQGAAYGNGVAQINGANSSIEFGGEVDNDVIFGGQSGEKLILDNSTPGSSAPATGPFNGSITGFGIGDTIDLRDFAFNSGAMALDPAHSSAGALDAGQTFTNNGGATDSGSLYLIGHYLNAQYTFASDGHQIGSTGKDGTLITVSGV